MRNELISYGKLVSNYRAAQARVESPLREDIPITPEDKDMIDELKIKISLRYASIEEG